MTVPADADPSPDSPSDSDSAAVPTPGSSSPEAAPQAAPQAAATPAKAKSAKAKSTAEAEEGPKLIIEQVLFALVLAFIFRAFVLEAFVIPTGSMAPTLLGAHMRFECPDCGWRFTSNFDTQGGTTAIPSQATYSFPSRGGWRTVPQTVGLHCPNCNYRLPRELPGDEDNDATTPPVYAGDRILVLKHLYLVREPDRWDTVVFKSTTRDPAKYNTYPATSTEPYQESVIKRLVGLPGESVLVLRGDVYTADAEANLSKRELRPENFQIRRKREKAQNAVWRVIYNDDHRPLGLSRTYAAGNGRTIEDPPFVVPWQPAGGEGWNTDTTGGFAFDNLDGAGTLRFDVDSEEENYPLTDFLTYNVTSALRGGSQGSNASEPGDFFGQTFNAGVSTTRSLRINNVSDLSLRLFYDRLEGEGPLSLDLTVRGTRFVARLLPNSVELLRAVDAETDELELLAAAPVDTDGRFVEFEHVDYRVQVKVDGEVALETTDEQYQPDVAALIELEQQDAVDPTAEIRIEAGQQRATLSHVSLWRDIYYTPRKFNGDWQRQATPQAFPQSVVQLGPDDFFVMGDNPALSLDARAWDQPIDLAYEDLQVEPGRVPRRFLMGRAFFIYWPAAYRPIPGVPLPVPNFGDMRFID